MTAAGGAAIAESAVSKGFARAVIDAIETPAEDRDPAKAAKADNLVGFMLAQARRHHAQTTPVKPVVGASAPSDQALARHLGSAERYDRGGSAADASYDSLRDTEPPAGETSFDLITDEEKAAAARRILKVETMGKPMLADETMAAEALAPNGGDGDGGIDLNSSILAALAGQTPKTAFSGKPPEPEAFPEPEAAKPKPAPAPSAAPEPAAAKLSGKALAIFKRLEAQDDGRDNWIFA